MVWNISRTFGRYALMAVAFTLCLHAQERWSWPDTSKNLQVLPKDLPGSRLGPVMKGFTGALGVRCWYCHTGEEGKPLSTFDFASDAKANKESLHV